MAKFNEMDLCFHSLKRLSWISCSTKIALCQKLWCLSHLRCCDHHRQSSPGYTRWRQNHAYLVPTQISLLCQNFWHLMFFCFSVFLKWGLGVGHYFQNIISREGNWRHMNLDSIQECLFLFQSAHQQSGRSFDLWGCFSGLLI